MFVMNLSGGFANQLFRFACGYQISKKFNQEMVLHIYDKKSYVDAFLLDELCIPEYKRIYMRTDHDVEKVKELLGMEKVVVINESNYECLNEKIFDKNTLVYVDAPFQRPVYFNTYINEIRDMFRMRYVSDEMKIFKQKIQNQNSVAIHVRRRDFVDARNAMGKQDINHFYKAAIVYCRKMLKTPVFYVFSDDISFCIDFFGNKNDINFVKIPGGKDADIEEFFCVSWCTHRILTRGSSFGRMADLLNSGKNKITIYHGEERDKDHFIYLNHEKIQDLYGEYDEGEVLDRDDGVAMKAPNSYFAYTKEFDKNILSVYLEKVQRQYSAGQLEGAEQTLIKAWQYGYDSSLLHKFYYRVLRGLSKREESIIEAVAYLQNGGKKEEIIRDFSDGEVNKIESFFSKGRQKYLIIPKEPYRNADLNQLCNLGILLRRMGNEVSYIFRTAKEEDGLNAVTNNEILVSNYMFTNCEGYMYQSRMYVWDIIKKQYDLNRFITYITGNDRCCLITDNFEVLQECKNKNLQRIYWKATNTYRYFHGNIKSAVQNFGNADRVITDDDNDAKVDKCIVIDKIPLAIVTNERISLSKQYAFDKELFDVIDQLILREDK